MLEDKKYLHDHFVFFDTISFKMWYYGRLREFNIKPKLHFADNTGAYKKNSIENNMYFSLDVNISADFAAILFLQPLEYISGYEANTCGRFLLYLIDENKAKIKEPKFLNAKQVEKCIDIFLENFDFEKEFAKKLDNM